MIRKEYPTQKQIKEILDYDPLSGVFIWKERTIDYFREYKNPSMSCITWNSQYKGSIAGSSKDNYIRIQIDKKPFAAHRLAWIYVYGDGLTSDLDHINRNKKDNRIDNLRMASFSQNMQNFQLFKLNTSKVRGVSWDTKRNKWKVYLIKDNEYIHLGMFTDLNHAAQARYNAEIKYGFIDFNPESSAYKYLQEAQNA